MQRHWFPILMAADKRPHVVLGNLADCLRIIADEQPAGAQRARWNDLAKRLDNLIPEARRISCGRS